MRRYQLPGLIALFVLALCSVALAGMGGLHGSAPLGAVAISNPSSGTPTTNSATLSFTTSPTAFGQICYGTTPALGTCPSRDSGGTSHSFTINSLATNTTYYWQANATAPSYTQGFYQILSFATSPSSTCPFPGPDNCGAYAGSYWAPTDSVTQANPLVPQTYQPSWAQFKTYVLTSGQTWPVVTHNVGPTTSTNIGWNLPCIDYPCGPDVPVSSMADVAGWTQGSNGGTSFYLSAADGYDTMHNTAVVFTANSSGTSLASISVQPSTTLTGASISGTTLSWASASGVGTPFIGQVVGGAGVTANTTITGYTSGNTATVSTSQTVASETMTLSGVLASGMELVPSLPTGGSYPAGVGNGTFLYNLSGTTATLSKNIGTQGTQTYYASNTFYGNGTAKVWAWQRYSPVLMFYGTTQSPVTINHINFGETTYQTTPVGTHGCVDVEALGVTQNIEIDLTNDAFIMGDTCTPSPGGTESGMVNVFSISKIHFKIISPFIWGRNSDPCCYFSSTKSGIFLQTPSNEGGPQDIENGFVYQIANILASGGWTNGNEASFPCSNGQSAPYNSPGYSSIINGNYIDNYGSVYFAHYEVTNIGVGTQSAGVCSDIKDYNVVNTPSAMTNSSLGPFFGWGTSTPSGVIEYTEIKNNLFTGNLVGGRQITAASPYLDHYDYLTDGCGAGVTDLCPSGGSVNHVIVTGYNVTGCGGNPGNCLAPIPGQGIGGGAPIGLQGPAPGSPIGGLWPAGCVSSGGGLLCTGGETATMNAGVLYPQPIDATGSFYQTGYPNASSANFSAGDTLTVGTAALTFVSSGCSGTAICVGATFAATVANIVTEVNGGGFNVTAAAVGSNRMSFTAVTPGYAGNSITTHYTPSGSAGGYFSGSTLSGGFDSVINEVAGSGFTPGTSVPLGACPLVANYSHAIAIDETQFALNPANGYLGIVNSCSANTATLANSYSGTITSNDQIRFYAAQQNGAFSNNTQSISAAEYDHGSATLAYPAWSVGAGYQAGSATIPLNQTNQCAVYSGFGNGVAPNITYPSGSNAANAEVYDGTTWIGTIKTCASGTLTMYAPPANGVTPAQNDTINIVSYAYGVQVWSGNFIDPIGGNGGNRFFTSRPSYNNVSSALGFQATPIGSSAGGCGVAVNLSGNVDLTNGQYNGSTNPNLLFGHQAGC